MPCLRQQLVDRIDGLQPCFDSFQALGSPATVRLFITQCQAGLDIEQLAYDIGQLPALQEGPAEDVAESVLDFLVGPKHGEGAPGGGSWCRRRSGYVERW